MSDFTNYTENKIVDHFLRGIAWTLPTTIYVGLFTSASSDLGPGTEVTGGSYARVQAGPSTTAWTATQGGTSGASSGTSGQTVNAIDIVFPAPSANWGTITHFGLFDALTGGNLLMQAALAVAKAVNAGEQPPRFPVGGLTVTVD